MARSNVVKLLDPRSFTSPLQWVAASAAVVGLVLALVGFLGASFLQERSLRNTPICADGETSGCLVAVEGEIERPTRNSTTRNFVPWDDGRTVRIDGLSDSDRRELVDGKRVDGLFDGSRLVGIDASGRKYFHTRIQDAGTGWKVLAFGGAGITAVGIGGLFLTRRRD
ncbi:MAG TPA: hypothetical protein VGE77_00700 [Nocardioides sp.]